MTHCDRGMERGLTAGFGGGPKEGPDSTAVAESPDWRALSRTTSVCPVCLRTVDARRVQREGDVLLVKRCPEHGEFAVPVWRGEPELARWVRPKVAAARRGSGTERNLGCPHDCGLCPDHAQHTCTLLVEVTARCNLRCPVCFAASVAPDGLGVPKESVASQPPEAGREDAGDPSREELTARLAALRPRAGDANVQLSGGEPTLRDDLPQLVAAVRALGYPFVQLNTNGLRLAREAGYARRLAEAGLQSVFLQFDGPDDAATIRLRGRALHADKVRAVDACVAAGLGVVLVCTVARGVNDHCLGQIVRFGLDRVPGVRGVHFQPVSFFGRYAGFGPKDETSDGAEGSSREAARITLPEVMRAVQEQTGGRVPVAHLHPPGCEHAQCSFSGTFVVHENGRLEPTGGACCGPDAPPIPAERGAELARNFVRRQWCGPENASGKPGATPPRDDFERFMARAARRFCVSGMAFQDAWTLDAERLRGCCIHVAAPDGRMVPFCAWNLTAVDGTPLHRGGTARAGLPAAGAGVPA